MTLEKSLFDKLLSPVIDTLFLESIKSPNINLANVPELPAYKVFLILVSYPLKPKP